MRGRNWVVVVVVVGVGVVVVVVVESSHHGHDIPTWSMPDTKASSSAISWPSL